MFLRDFKTYFEQALTPTYPLEEVQSFFYMLLENRLKLNRFAWMQQPNMVLSSLDYNYFTNAISALKAYMPIQYFLGTATFGALDLEVGKGVLIPRPETLELVHLVQAYCLAIKGPIKILDIGTGSGCIAISLALAIPNAVVHAIDISESALAIAKNNASIHGVSIAFKKADVLALTSLGETYNVIVSNPPYVRVLEQAKMSKNVLDYEPQTALFVSNEDPLVFYRKIGVLAQKALTNKGALFFEINEHLGLETKALLDKMRFALVRLHKDIFTKDRMIKAIK